MSIEAELPSPDWAEVRLSVLAGKDEESARDDMIARYLDSADPRPLISAIVSGKISARMRRLIVALFEEQPRENRCVPVVVGIRPSDVGAKGGRPSYGPDDTDLVQLLNDPYRSGRRATKFLAACLMVLSDGRTLAEPAWKRFLEGVAKGLILGHPEHYSLGVAPEFPLALRLRFREPLGHKPSDPALEMRDRFLRWQVERTTAAGGGKVAAIRKVAADNRLSFETVRAAVYAQNPHLI